MKKLYATLFATAAVIAFSTPGAAETVVTKQTTTTTSTSTATGVPVTTTMTTSPVVTTTVPVAPVTSTIVTEKTVHETPKIVPGTNVVNFMAYDVNNDGILSTNEVGEMLFKLYDTDGNNVIDNIEYERKAVLTVTPVDKMTITKYDFNNDGIADQANYTYESFLKDTQLSRFDKNNDGLSPHEFTNMEFLVIDANNDKAVEMKEWKGSYIESVRKKNEEQNRTNK